MLERVIEQMGWANAIVIDWIRKPEVTDPYFHRLVCHILNAETVWLRRIEGREQDPDTFRIIPVEDLPGLNQEHMAAYGGLINTDLHRVVEYRLFNGSPGSTTVQDIILHVVTHGFHHRGQIAAKASALGHKLPDASYIGFTRQIG